jgi:hypothetical protein
MARYNNQRTNNNRGGVTFYLKPHKVTGKNGAFTMYKGKSKGGAYTVTMTEMQNTEFGEFKVQVFGIGSSVYRAKTGAYKAGLNAKGKSGDDTLNMKDLLFLMKGDR